MDSFGLYVKSKNGKESKIKLHVNLWELNKKKCYLDFGIWISNPTELDSLIFTMPFSISKNDFQDLAKITCSKNRITNLVFNRQTEINKIAGTSQDSKEMNVLKIYDKKELAVEKTAYFYELSSEENLKTNYNNFSTINLDIQKTLADFFKQSKKSTEENIDLYCRFRIKKAKLRDDLLSTIEKKTLGFESAFTRTEIIDFKINETRNMRANIIKSIPDAFHYANLSRVDFFVMELAQNEIDDSGNPAERRYLETDWKDYISEKDIKKMIAYQWTKDKNDETFFSYSKLVKIVYSSTNFVVLFIYVVVVLGLSILGNYISHLFNI